MRARKTLLLISVLLFSALLMAIAGDAYAFPAVRVYPTSLNFGSVREGGSSSRVFYVANTGTTALRVTLNAGSPMIRLSRVRFIVGPGSRVPVRATFLARFSGVRYRSGRVVVNTNAGRRYVYWRARVIPSYRPPPPRPSGRRGVSRTLIDFGVVVYGRDTKYITLYNPLPFPITVRIRPGAPWIRVRYASIRIPAFGSRRLPISVYVDYFPGSFAEGYVSFYFPWGVINVRVTARLGGGYPPPYTARVRVYPTYLDFGTVWYGMTRVRTFVVRNYSSSPIRVRLSENVPWLRVYPMITYIPAYSSRTFRVRVYGTNLPPGWRSAYIRVYTPAGSYSVRIVARGGI